MPSKKTDIFDQVAAQPQPTGDIFDQITAAPTAPPKPAPAPAGNTIGPAPDKGMLGNAWDAVANSAVGHSLEQTMPRVADALHLRPTETVNSPDYQAHKQQFVAPEYLAPAPTSVAGRVTRGALRATGQLTSAPALAQTTGIAATGGLLAPLAASAGAAGTVGRIGMNALKYGMAAQGAQGVYQGGKKAVSLYDSGDTAGAQEAAGEVIPGAAMMIPAAGEAMNVFGQKMQEAGTGAMNRYVLGVRKTDVRRGANPGEGYFKAGFGPSSSMASIDNKFSTGVDKTGAAIGSAIENGTGRGVLLPQAEVQDAIQSPATKARDILNGDFGEGSSALDARMSRVRPITQDQTPKQAWDIKRNVAQNVSWGDANQPGIKQVGQQIAGGLSGVIANHVTELQPLNEQYQNLLSGANLAHDRAVTGQMPMSSMARKVGAAGTAAAIGALFGGAKGAVVGLGGAALDSVPVKTTAASGLYYGGKALSGTGNAISRISAPLGIRSNPMVPPTRFMYSVNPPKKR